LQLGQIRNARNSALRFGSRYLWQEMPLALWDRNQVDGLGLRIKRVARTRPIRMFRLRLDGPIGQASAFKEPSHLHSGFRHRDTWL
jgi:hypothetical protein